MISSIINTLSGKVSVNVSIKGSVKLPWTKMRVTNDSTQATIDDILQRLVVHNLNVNHLRFKFGRHGSYCTYDSLPENAVDNDMHIMIISLGFTRTPRLVHRHQQQQHQQRQHQQRQHQQQHQHQRQMNQRQMHQPKITIEIVINDKMRSIEVKRDTNLKMVCRSIINKVRKLHIYATEFKFTRDDPRGGKRPVYGDTWKLFYHVKQDINLDDDITIHCRLKEDVPIGFEHCSDCGALGGGGCKH